MDKEKSYLLKKLDIFYHINSKESDLVICMSEFYHLLYVFVKDIKGDMILSAKECSVWCSVGSDDKSNGAR